MKQINNTITIIWASNKKESFWNKVLLDLINKWYKIIPINPKYESIEGIKTYKDLKSIREDYWIICFIVNSEITAKIIKENTDIIKNKFLWFQPWSYDDNINKILKEINHNNFEYKSCIMYKKIEI